jgi:peptide-methionine (R)-S-oxide reductase
MKSLSPEAERVLKGQGTETPFSGKYLNTKDKGLYCCAYCGTALFSSDTKFDSGTGWPSFYDAIHIKTKDDNSHFMKRVEVLCGTCKGHLGHVFDDGPKPTGKRYCINSVALELKKDLFK